MSEEKKENKIGGGKKKKRNVSIKKREQNEKLKEDDFGNLSKDALKHMLSNQSKEQDKNESNKMPDVEKDSKSDNVADDKSKGSSKLQDEEAKVEKSAKKDESNKNKVDGGDNDEMFSRDINIGVPGKVVTDKDGNIVKSSSKDVENNANGKSLIGEMGNHSAKDQNKAVVGVDITAVSKSDGQNIGAFGNIIKYSPDIDIGVPALKYKKLSDIPIWVKQLKIDNYRYKLYRNEEFDFKSEWFNDVPSLITGLVIWILQMVEKYDFILIDEPFDISNLSGKRMIRNLNMSKEVNVKPWLINEGLYESEINYTQFDNYYIDGSQIRKNELDNVRTGITVIIDQRSLEMLQTFARHQDQFYILPIDYSSGFYDMNQYLQLVSVFLDKNRFVQSRETEFSKRYNESRSFVRLIHSVLPIKELIREYYIFNQYYSKMWSNLWVRPLVESMTVEFTDTNPYYTFFTNTSTGNPTNRQTSRKKFASIYNKDLAAEFLGILLNLVLDPKGTMELLPYNGIDTSTNADLTVIAETLMFMYLFKPQICSRSYATVILYKVLRYIVTADRLDNNINVSVNQLMQQVGVGLSFTLIQVLTDWYNYSISPYNLDADYNALYDNNGRRFSLSNNNNIVISDDNSGLLFWGFDALAFNPFRTRPFFQELTMVTDMVNMFELNGGFNSNILGDHFKIMKEFFQAVLHTQNATFSENFAMLFSRIFDICATPGYINRFKCGDRNNVYYIKNSSLLSFGLGVMNPNMKELKYNFTNMIVKLFYDDYYLSMIANFYIAHERIDQLVCNYSRIASLNNDMYYKVHERWFKIREYFKDTFFYDMTKNMNKEQLINLNILADGTMQPGRELHRRIMVLYQNEINSIDPFSRFCVFNKVVNWVVNTANWSKVGVYEGFYIGNMVESVTIDELRVKNLDQNQLNTMHIDYFIDKLRFGDKGFKVLIRNALYTGMRIFVRVPTFMKAVNVDKNLSSNNSNFKFAGKNNILEWLNSRPELHSIDSPKIDIAEITFEFLSNKNATLDKEYIIIEPLGVMIVDAPRKYFITSNYSDVDEIIYGKRLVCSCILDELQDQSGEIFDCLPIGKHGRRIQSFVQSYN